MPVVWDVQKVVQANVQINAPLDALDVPLIVVGTVAVDATDVLLDVEPIVKVDVQKLLVPVGVRQGQKKGLHVLEHHVKANVKVIVQVDVRAVTISVAVIVKVAAQDALRFVEAAVAFIV